MFQKLSIVTALSATLFVGGAFQNSVDASAGADQSQSQAYNVYYSVNGNWNTYSENNIDELCNKVQRDKEEQSEQKEEQDKESQAEQKEDQSANEEQPEEKEDQPEASAPQQPNSNQEQQNQDQEQSQELSQFEQEVVELTNQEREKHGLRPLEIDTELSEVARDKSQDMAQNNYFSHDSPTHGSPFDMMQSYGVDYSTAGENIAKGQTTPEQVVNGWMNSDGHRANILNEDFTHIGVGYVEQGNHWTQQFIGK
ncbi:hypothetical protein KFZ56_06465 [Virgibacillus sp. NKC19-3]|uniref:CAP domain-containing protein n=1 Tax=Virgibacillus saliphilus TaxID=2831674 RepID=UPI001C9B7305|nr:CAP domain-containing protein [Virgibacillus sp. NKC19-3]MBY7142724.1 hypothetical protein [Virgibacillus sp. NKC19-3]